MQLKFYKYQGTGNDFVMLDGIANSLPQLSQQQIEKLCHRRFGIGADGLIILSPATTYDFEMIYYNSDGRQSSMCGNGGRCIVRFAHDQGILKDEYHFYAIDGPHKARVQDTDVSLQMKDVNLVENVGKQEVFLDTGSPHYVTFAEEVEQDSFVSRARHIRNNERFKEEGVNVNFVKVADDQLNMRTYERGVEDETYSCGTGVTASVLAARQAGLLKKNEAGVRTRGGDLRVSFDTDGENYWNVWLHGPAEKVFEGTVEI